MREKEYCVKAKLNKNYILYIANIFGKYHVMVTDEKQTHCYSVFGGYKNIGTAANKIKQSSSKYHCNNIELHYTTKTILAKYGAMNLPN